MVVGTKELSEDVGMNRYRMRVRMRRLGWWVGKGHRYEWAGRDDPDYVRLLSLLRERR